jgi:hypothetical protein
MDLADCGCRPCTGAATDACPSGRRMGDTADGVDDYMKVGWLEIYVSRNLALFGIRCATLDTETMLNNKVHLRCTEDGYNAHGRYVYIRSFESKRMLRIGGAKFYSDAAAESRRLGEEAVAEQSTEPATESHDNNGEDDPAKQSGVDSEEHEERHRDLHRTRMATLAANMVNLTKTVCKERLKNPEAALEARRDASLLWAELDERASNGSCFDCVSMQNLSCLNWFAHNYGMSSERGPKAQRVRHLRESMARDYPERRRKLEEGLGASCCRRSLRTGEKVCGKEHCHGAMRQNARQRMGHVLRRMHESGHIELSVEQRVAVDVVAPHLHSDPRCRSTNTNSKRVDRGVTETECLASSLASHIAEKHGLSKGSIDKELGKYGLSIAKMLAHPFKVAASASQTMGNFRSSPEFAAAAAKLKERRRKMEEQSGTDSRRLLRQNTLPRGRALKEARTAVQEGVNTPDRAGVLEHHRDPTVAKGVMGAWMQNASRFVRGVHVASDKQRASSLMPQVHSHTSSARIFHMESVGDTIAAVVGSDGSVVNTVARSAASLGSIMQRASDLVSTVETAEKARVGMSPNTRISKDAVESFYKEVDQRIEEHLTSKPDDPGSPRRSLSSSDVGFTPPEAHVKAYGWVAGAANWRKLVEDTHAASHKLLQRHDHVLDHVGLTGYLPRGSVKDEHLTGIQFLDLNAPPSIVGNMFRRLHAWITNRHASDKMRHSHTRRMHESLSSPRKDGPNVQHSAMLAAIGASVTGNDPLGAVWETLENGNHHKLSHARRLAESVLGAAASVPLMATSVNNKYSSYDQTGGGVDWLKESVRYIVYDTLLCYLYDPSAENEDGGDFGDGTNVKTHRSRKMCAPAIVAGPSKMQLFRQYYGVGDLDFGELEFEKACKSEAVRSVLGSLGQNLARNVITTAPMGSILRVAEGIDSVRNLARSGMQNATEFERGAAIVCGISQLGGLLFSALAIVTSLVLLLCAPLGSAIAVMICRRCKINRKGRKYMARRNMEIDNMLAERNFKPKERDATGEEATLGIVGGYTNTHPNPKGSKNMRISSSDEKSRLLDPT